MNVNYTDRIYPTHKGLTTYLDELISRNYQIPTFQREVVWDRENVKKLWDSIYKFYPLGSILIWKTDLQLQNHRSVGGHQITDVDFKRVEYQYILDGQQRTTSLLTSLYGGIIEGKEKFDPTIYVDLTVKNDSDVDDESYRRRFLFPDEISQAKLDSGVVASLRDIKLNFDRVQEKLVNHDEVKQVYSHSYWVELRKVKQVLDNYRISFIEVKGIEVSEVCQIFERINQAGKPLSIFDIVVAKTFKPKGSTSEGFYLRELIEKFRETNRSPFLQISDMDYLQILAVLINRNVANSGVRNITDRYLNEIQTEHIIAVWENAKKAMLKTFDFFENTLHIKTPYLIPFRYFYMTISAYFYNNTNPDYSFLKKYFWYNSFHNDDLLSNTTQMLQHVNFLESEKTKKSYYFNRFLLDRNSLRGATYSSKGRFSRAILALYANKQPKDWEHCDRNVLVENFFFSTDKPNLHHIFPTNSSYVLNSRHINKISSDSLMNIAYVIQATNLEISNKNPLQYIKAYDKPEFEAIMGSHLLPSEILDWCRAENMPDDALDIFIEKRVDLILSELQSKISGVVFDVIDTRPESIKTPAFDIDFEF